MATIRQRLHKKNSSGVYDTVHLETSADLIVGAVPVAHGGTGATSAAAARTNLGITLGNLGAAASSHTHTIAQITSLQNTLNGKAPASHTHSASQITSGTLGVARGGTGVTSLAGLRTALNVFKDMCPSTYDPNANNEPNGTYNEVDFNTLTANGVYDIRFGWWDGDINYIAQGPYHTPYGESNASYNLNTWYNLIVIGFPGRTTQICSSVYQYNAGLWHRTLHGQTWTKWVEIAANGGASSSGGSSGGNGWSSGDSGAVGTLSFTQSISASCRFGASSQAAATNTIALNGTCTYVTVLGEDVSGNVNNIAMSVPVRINRGSSHAIFRSNVTVETDPVMFIIGLSSDGRNLTVTINPYRPAGGSSNFPLRCNFTVNGYT